MAGPPDAAGLPVEYTVIQPCRKQAKLSAGKLNTSCQRTSVLADMLLLIGYSAGRLLPLRVSMPQD